MAAIHSKDTVPEKYIRSLLFREGYRFRKNYSKLPGHPDIWMKKYNTAIFIHGCFWHRHKNCKYSYYPKTRVDFWDNKFKKNIQRDNETINKLSGQGIKCLIIWECLIKKMLSNSDIKESVMEDIETFLLSDDLYAELS